MNHELSLNLSSPIPPTMPTFDIVGKIDGQTLDNAVNTAKKEILNRYDFHDSKSAIDLDKKTNTITVVTETDMRLKAIQDAIIGRMVKQNLDPKALDFGKEQYASGNMIRKEIKIREGIDKEAAKKIVKKIKDSGLKVQASVMDDQVRVQGKKIDDLQAVIALCRKDDFGQPLQYINMRD
jgi:cyclic-di-GMP-binding protein